LTEFINKIFEIMAKGCILGVLVLQIE